MTEHEQLIRILEYLKLNEIISHLGDTVDFITKNSLSFEQGLIKLTNYEIDQKEAKLIRAMIKTGAFSHHKEIDDFDFEFQESISKLEPTDLEYHARTNNKLDLQDIVLTSLNELLIDKSKYQQQLKKNIATIIQTSAASTTNAIDDKLMELQ